MAPSKANGSIQHLSVRNTDEEQQHISAEPATHSEAPIRKPAFPVPSALSWLPEFEWTDEDEMVRIDQVDVTELQQFAVYRSNYVAQALDKLENDEEIPGSGVGDTNNIAKGNEVVKVDSSKSDAPKEQKAHDRLESRKKLEALLSASLKNASGGALRKPRWRLEAEAESDDVSPFEIQDTEAMEPLHIFRSAVLAVLHTVHLQKLLMAKKLAEKESAMRVRCGS